MPKCKRCGSNDVVEHKGQLRCSVCDTVVGDAPAVKGHLKKIHDTITEDWGQPPKPPKLQPIRKTEVEVSPPPIDNVQNAISGQQWEYNVVRCEKGVLVGLFVKAHQGSGQSAPDHIKGQPIGKAFDLWGKAGWELVSSETESSWFGPLRATKLFIFKRPLRS
jgi:hypothetical protein